MDVKEGVEVQITFDKLWEVAKSTWHVAVLLGTLIWMVAGYKAGLEGHLNTIDNQLKNEDIKLNWLISHHSDKDDLSAPPVYVPQAQKVKPQSFLRPLSILEAENSPEVSRIPLLK